MPDSRIEIVEGNGHWSNRQSPGRVNRLIAAFLIEDHCLGEEERA